MSVPLTEALPTRVVGSPDAYVHPSAASAGSPQQQRPARPGQQQSRVNSPVIDCRKSQSRQRNQARRSCPNLASAPQQGNPEEQERGEEVELQHAPRK